MASRPWPVPPSGNTLQLVGDMHMGQTRPGIAHAKLRAYKIKEDMDNSVLLPTVPGRIQIGDFVESANDDGVQDNDANNWANSVGGPWYGVTGNHDIWGVRSTAQAMTAYTSWAYNVPNWTEDLGFVRLIGIGLERYDPATSLCYMDQVALDYLDAQLAAATKDCIVMCHVPLNDTLLPVVEAPAAGGEFTTRSGGPSPTMILQYEAGTTKTIPGILNARSRAKMFLTGHTHNSVGTPGFFMLKNLSAWGAYTRNVIFLNCSATVYVGGTIDPWSDPLNSVFLTWNASTVDVRIRNHSARCWVGIGDTKVSTLAIPA